jgi:hypothetical protein
MSASFRFDPRPLVLAIALAASPLAAAGTGGFRDLVFLDGLDGAPSQVSDYDDLAEGFLGTAYAYNGMEYHDVNGIGGVFPNGDTFTPGDVGDQLIIEDATDFYAAHADWASSPNAMTFGTTYIPGPNLSIGALVRVTMDLAAQAAAASVDIGFYENGPWGGIVLHLDALAGGTVVASDTLTIADGGGRDNDTVATLGVDGATFDQLMLYATYDDQPSAPRVLMDNLTLTAAD